MTDFEGRDFESVNTPGMEDAVQVAEFDITSTSAGEDFARWAALNAGLSEQSAAYEEIVNCASHLTQLAIDVTTANELGQPTFSFFEQIVGGRRQIPFDEYVAKSIQALPVSGEDREFGRHVIKESVQLGMEFVNEYQPDVSAYSPLTGELTIHTTNTEENKE